MNEMQINTVLDDKIMAQSLCQQYDDIAGGVADLVRKVVTFGCALAEAERILKARGIIGAKRDGDGFNHWIAENCPTINYKTAQRWKQVALGVSNSLGCDAPTALDILNGNVEVSGKQATRRDEILSAESVRKLSAVLFNFGMEDHGAVGRPSGTSSAGEKLTARESARRLWASVLCLVARNREGLYKSSSLLPIDEARAALQEFKMIVSALDKRCKERS